MTEQNQNYENPTTPKPGFKDFDERTGQAVIEAARTGLYAAAGLADAMADAVKHSYVRYQDEVRQRREKRAAQAEEVRNFISQAPGRASNLPEQAKEVPDQVRVRAEAFLTEARTALTDLAERGKVAVERVRTEGVARTGDARTGVTDPNVPVTEEGFGVNADRSHDAPFTAGSRHDEDPGEGFGVHPSDIENAGLAGEDVPADNLGEAAPVPGPDDAATEPVVTDTGLSDYAKPNTDSETAEQTEADTGLSDYTHEPGDVTDVPGVDGEQHRNDTI